jgi:hypothetical protein
VQVASWCLDPARGGHAAGLPRREAGRPDQPLDRGRGGIVVRGVEQHGQRVAVGVRGERVRAKRAEGLDVVRGCQPRSDRPSYRARPTGHHGNAAIRASFDDHRPRLPVGDYSDLLLRRRLTRRELASRLSGCSGGS